MRLYCHSLALSLSLIQCICHNFHIVYIGNSFQICTCIEWIDSFSFKFLCVTGWCRCIFSPLYVLNYFQLSSIVAVLIIICIFFFFWLFESNENFESNHFIRFKDIKRFWIWWFFSKTSCMLSYKNDKQYVVVSRVLPFEKVKMNENKWFALTSNAFTLPKNQIQWLLTRYDTYKQLD